MPPFNLFCALAGGAAGQLRYNNQQGRVELNETNDIDAEDNDFYSSRAEAKAEFARRMQSLVAFSSNISNDEVITNSIINIISLPSFHCRHVIVIVIIIIISYQHQH